MNCGRKNDQTDSHCTKCSIEQETAMTMNVEKRRRTCEECGHIHHEDVFCHVYTDAADDGEVDDTMVEDEEDSDNSQNSDNDDDNAAFGLLNRKKSQQISTQKKKAIKMKPLKTPDYARIAGFIRCNCQVGIPNDSLKYEPIPRYLYNGKIQIQTFYDIMDPYDRNKFDEQVRIRCYAPEVLRKRKEEDMNIIAEKLPLILSYLTYEQCSQAPKVCKA